MAFHNPNPEEEKRGSGGLQTLVQAEKLLQIAIMIPAAVFIGWVAGAALDKWLHQQWIYILGILLGCVAGLSSAVRMALQAGASAARGSKSGGKGSTR